MTESTRSDPTPGSPREEVKLAELATLSLCAALMFFAVFWAIRNPGRPQLFSIVALIFAVPALFLRPFRRLLKDRRAPVVLGALIAAGCALGSILPLETALTHVYGAPWFLVFLYWFNLSCVLIALDILRRSISSGNSSNRARAIVLAMIHISFVIVSIGMATDGYTARRGYFETTLKTAPGVMPPEMGFLAPGEQSSRFLTSDRDPGTDLPFTILLKSFDVEFYPSNIVAFSPSSRKGELSGYSFELTGFITPDNDEPVTSLPDRVPSEIAAILVVKRGKMDSSVPVPLDSKEMGDFGFSFNSVPDSGGWEIVISAPKVVKRYTSVVDVIEDGEVTVADAVIEVNKPLRLHGWTIYQAAWGQFVSMDEWEAMPGNVRSPEAFPTYLDLNGIPPCSYFSVTRTPGALIVWIGYALAFVSLVSLFSFAGSGHGGKS